MIELCPLPIFRCVTGFALRREVPVPVIGIRGFFKIRSMAPVAVVWRSGKTTAYMALDAGGSGMGPC